MKLFDMMIVGMMTFIGVKVVQKEKDISNLYIPGSKPHVTSGTSVGKESGVFRCWLCRSQSRYKNVVKGNKYVCNCGWCGLLCVFDADGSKIVDSGMCVDSKVFKK